MTRQNALSLTVYTRIRDMIHDIAMTAMPRELVAPSTQDDTDIPPCAGKRDALSELLDELIFVARKIDMGFNSWEEEDL